MTNLISLPDFYIAMFSAFAFLTCTLNIYNTVISITVRKFSYTFFDLVLFGASFMPVQVLCDILERNVFRITTNFSVKCGSIPYFYWSIYLALVFGASLLFTYLNRNWGKNHITPNAVKECADKMPCGICYFEDSGKIMLSNNCMDELYIKLYGKPVFDGRNLYPLLQKTYVEIDGEIWRFSKKRVVVKGIELNEVVASNVNEIYSKTKTLRENNERISALNNELREYNLNIDETVKKEKYLMLKQIFTTK